MTVEAADAADLQAIRALLSASGLPAEGLDGHLSTAFVWREAGELVGVAALEIHGPYGLLRSVAVSEKVRGRGFGRALSRAALDLARARGLESVYLLTLTAAGFFPRLGFRVLPRGEVPADIRQSPQFTSVRCASATAMVADLTAA